MALTRIISDLHLGHPGSRVREVKGLRPLIEGCSKIIFNGDTWEDQWSAVRAASETKKKELIEFVSDHNVEAAFLSGNHDPHEKHGRYLKIGPRNQILVTHGDGIFPEASPFSREMSGKKAKKVRQLIAANPDGDRTLQARLERAAKISDILTPRSFPKLPPPLNFLSTALWPPGRPFQIARAWLTLGDAGFQFLDTLSPETQVLICGHFHRTGIWEKNNRLVLNTGGLIRACPARLVELNHDLLTYRQIQELDGTFYPSTILQTWRLT